MSQDQVRHAQQQLHSHSHNSDEDQEDQDEDSLPPSYEEAISHIVESDSTEDSASYQQQRQHALDGSAASNTSTTLTPFSLNSEIQGRSGGGHDNRDADAISPFRKSRAQQQAPDDGTSRMLMQTEGASTSSIAGSVGGESGSGDNVHVHEHGQYGRNHHNPFGNTHSVFNDRFHDPSQQMSRHLRHQSHHEHGHGHGHGHGRGHEHPHRHSHQRAPSIGSNVEPSRDTQSGSAATFTSIPSSSQAASSSSGSEPLLPGIAPPHLFPPGPFLPSMAHTGAPGRLFGGPGSFGPPGFGMHGGPSGFGMHGGAPFGMPPMFRPPGDFSNFPPGFPRGPFRPFSGPNPLPGSAFSFPSEPSAPPAPPAAPGPSAAAMDRSGSSISSAPGSLQAFKFVAEGSETEGLQSKSSAPSSARQESPIAPTNQTIVSASEDASDVSASRPILPPTILPVPLVGIAHAPRLMSTQNVSTATLAGIAHAPGLMSTQDVSTATFTRSKRGLETQDSLLDDPYQLYRFLVAHNDKPSMHILITGSHVEKRSSEEHNVDGTTKMVQQKVKVNDFKMDFDLTPYISSTGTLMALPEPKTGNQPTLRQVMEQHVEEENPFKELHMEKKVVWDYEDLTRAITHAIRSVNYRYTIEISYPMTNSRIIVHSASPLANFMRSGWTKVFCFVSLVGVAMYPLREMYKKVKSNVLQSEFQMTVSTRDFYMANYWNIVDQVQYK